MSYVIKTEPFEGTAGSTVSLSHPCMYGGDTISAGSEVFLWFSETKGGSGLSWLCLAEHVADAEPPIVTARLLYACAGQKFGIEELEPFRDSTDELPISTLAKKLYAHSHEKVASLNSGEAFLLRAQFVTAQAG